MLLRCFVSLILVCASLQQDAGPGGNDTAVAAPVDDGAAPRDTGAAPGNTGVAGQAAPLPTGPGTKTLGNPMSGMKAENQSYYDYYGDEDADRMTNASAFAIVIFSPLGLCIVGLMLFTYRRLRDPGPTPPGTKDWTFDTPHMPPTDVSPSRQAKAPAPRPPSPRPHRPKPAPQTRPAPYTQEPEPELVDSQSLPSPGEESSASYPRSESRKLSSGTETAESVVD